jgi:hypothetical protein
MKKRTTKLLDFQKLVKLVKETVTSKIKHYDNFVASPPSLIPSGSSFFLNTSSFANVSNKIEKPYPIPLESSSLENDFSLSEGLSTKKELSVSQATLSPFSITRQSGQSAVSTLIPVPTLSLTASSARTLPLNLLLTTPAFTSPTMSGKANGTTSPGTSSSAHSLARTQPTNAVTPIVQTHALSFTSGGHASAPTIFPSTASSVVAISSLNGIVSPSTPQSSVSILRPVATTSSSPSNTQATSLPATQAAMPPSRAGHSSAINGSLAVAGKSPKPHPTSTTVSSSPPPLDTYSARPQTLTETTYSYYLRQAAIIPISALDTTFTLAQDLESSSSFNQPSTTASSSRPPLRRKPTPHRSRQFDKSAAESQHSYLIKTLEESGKDEFEQEIDFQRNNFNLISPEDTLRQLLHLTKHTYDLDMNIQDVELINYNRDMVDLPYLPYHPVDVKNVKHTPSTTSED